MWVAADNARATTCSCAAVMMVEEEMGCGRNLGGTSRDRMAALICEREKTEREECNDESLQMKFTRRY